MGTDAIAIIPFVSPDISDVVDEAEALRDETKVLKDATEASAGQAAASASTSAANAGQTAADVVATAANLASARRRATRPCMARASSRRSCGRSALVSLVAVRSWAVLAGLMGHSISPLLAVLALALPVGSSSLAA
ncbi:MAG: hypothetical protein E5V72_06070 [Mesorhizobium sp.]|nr:MAG: hypothetical protein E5V72_06070 [Mesorhizobium sp.]